MLVMQMVEKMSSKFGWLVMVTLHIFFKQGVMANSVRVSFSNDNHHHETLTLEDTNIRHLCGK